MKQSILITGGSGFLGQNLAKMLRDDYELTLASRNERNLQRVASALKLAFYPLDVSNELSVYEAIRRIKPSIIIHAAATKFVDLAEKFPNECIDINVKGSQNIARAAIHFNIPQVIGISTDKVTSPIANLYGHSKAIMERLFLLQNNLSETKFLCVRYGNVAWSTGSVLPLWEKMSLDLKKVTSTGPHMNRFFFSINQAVELVVKAIKYADQLEGKTLSLPMKASNISRVLDIWSEIYGVSWVEAERRFGDRDFEILIAENELNRTMLKELGGQKLFLMNLSENVPSSEKLSEIYSSVTAIQLSDDEIYSLIRERPDFI